MLSLAHVSQYRAGIAGAVANLYVRFKVPAGVHTGMHELRVDAFISSGLGTEKAVGGAVVCIEVANVQVQHHSHTEPVVTRNQTHCWS